MYKLLFCKLQSLPPFSYSDSKTDIGFCPSHGQTCFYVIRNTVAVKHLFLWHASEKQFYIARLTCSPVPWGRIHTYILNKTCQKVTYNHSWDFIRYVFRNAVIWSDILNKCNKKPTDGSRTSWVEVAVSTGRLVGSTPEVQSTQKTTATACNCQICWS